MRRIGSVACLFTAVVTLSGCALPGAQESSSGIAGAVAKVAAPDAACAFVELDLAMVALGTKSPSKVAGPTAMADGTCNWHSTDPQCFMRSLSATVHTGGELGQQIDAAIVGSARVSEIEGIGQRAVLSTVDLPLGSAIEIHHLDVLDGEVWIRYTLSGRLNRDSSRRLLSDLATNVHERVA